MKTIVLTYGLIAGVVLSAMLLFMLLLEELIGYKNCGLVAKTTMALTLLSVFLGVKTYRAKFGQEQLHFAQAFLPGALITLLAAACYALTWKLIFWNLVPHSSGRMHEIALQEAMLAGASSAEIAKMSSEMPSLLEQWYRDPFFSIPIGMLDPLLLGLVFSIAAAIWFRAGHDTPIARKRSPWR